MNGKCYECEWYNDEDDLCKLAEKSFSRLCDPICLQKITVILLRDIASMYMDE